MKTTWAKLTHILSFLVFSCGNSSTEKIPFSVSSNSAITEVSIGSTRYSCIEISGFNQPFDTTRDKEGNLLITEFPLRKILKFNSSNKFINWIGVLPNGAFTSNWQLPESYSTEKVDESKYSRPHSIIISPDNPSNFLVTYYGDVAENANIISRYNLDTGEFLSSFGMTTPLAFSENFTPDKKLNKGKYFFQGLVNSSYDQHGNFYISDYKSNSILKFNNKYIFIGWIGAKALGGITNGWSVLDTPVASKELGGFDRPHNIAFDSTENMYVVDTWNNRIQKFDKNGVFVGWLGATSDKVVTNGWEKTGASAPSTMPGGFQTPIAIRISEKDELYVLEYQGGRLQKFNLDGVYQGSIAGYNLPYGLQLIKDEIIVTDSSNKRVLIYKKIDK